MALFKNNTKQENPMARQSSRQVSAASPGQINMIGEGTRLEGTLHAKNDVRISGTLVGTLRVEGKAIIAQEGAVEGELYATSADVAGRLDGQVEVEERVVLRTSARVDGNVKTARLVMEEGAVFDGKCLMTRKPPPERTAASGDGAAQRAAQQAPQRSPSPKEAAEGQREEASRPSRRGATRT